MRVVGTASWSTVAPWRPLDVFLGFLLLSALGSCSDPLPPQPADNPLNYPAPNGPVHAVAVDGLRVYIGGEFTEVGGQQRSGLACYSAVTGELLSWNPGIAVDDTFPWQPAVYDLKVRNGIVFVGGAFQWIAGKRRNNLAGIGTIPGFRPDSLGGDTVQVLGWSLQFDGPVNLLSTNGEVLHFKGEFSQINEEPYNGFGAISPFSGVLLPFRPPLDAQQVRHMRQINNDLWVGGVFTGVGTPPRDYLAVVDPSAGFLLDVEAGVAGGAVEATWRDPGRIYLGGSFITVGGKDRRGLALLNEATLEVEDEALCSVNGSLYSLHQAGTLLFMGGEFGTVCGRQFQNLAAYSITDTSMLEWAPLLDGPVRDIASEGQQGALYIAGDFRTINGLERPYFAAFNLE